MIVCSFCCCIDILEFNKIIFVIDADIKILHIMFPLFLFIPKSVYGDVIYLVYVYGSFG